MRRTSADTPRRLPQLFMVYNNTVRNLFYRFYFIEDLQLVKLIQICVADNRVSISSWYEEEQNGTIILWCSVRSGHWVSAA